MRAPRYGRRLSAAVAAVALGATALMGVAVSAASAAPSNIDPSTPRSLTIHKLSQPATPGTAGDGSELAPGSLPAGALPIDGAGFTVQRVDQIGGQTVNLTTDAGWATVQPYLNGTSTFDPAAATLVDPVTLTTANGGVAVFDTLPVGLFWVTESAPPANATGPAQPFLVTLPMPTTEPGVFRYDVHAYPKNEMSGPVAVKTVNDQNAHAIGDAFTWTVSAQIPNIPGYTVNTYAVCDPKNPARVWETRGQGMGCEFEVEGLRLVAARVVSPSGVATTLNPQSQTVGGNRSWLEAADLAAVNAVGPGAVIEFVYEAAMIGQVPEHGVVENKAMVCLNSDPRPVECGRGDFDDNLYVRAESLWGKAQFTKHAAGDASKVLAGAEFQVFASEAEAHVAAARVAAGQPVTDGLTFTTGTWNADIDWWDHPVQTQTLISNDQGIVTVPGLKASQAGIKYWAVETKAPAGYVASTTPIEFTVTPGATPTGAAAVHVPNQMRQAGALPVLGGAGMTAIGIGGATLITGGVLFAVFGRRKRDTEHTPAAA